VTQNAVKKRMSGLLQLVQDLGIGNAIHWRSCGLCAHDIRSSTVLQLIFCMMMVMMMMMMMIVIIIA
jgi:hypothetical protein